MKKNRTEKSLLNEVGDRDIMLGDLENSESRWDFGYCGYCKCCKVEEVKTAV